MVIPMRRTLLFLVGTLCSFAQAQGIPRVVVSIPPLYSLTRDVMDGVATPALIIDTPSLGHDASLTPSQVRTLKNADLLVWVGPAMESFLSPYGITHTDSAFAMSAQKGVRLLGSSCAHTHGDCAHTHSADATHDPHLWLDPHNARIFVEALSQRLVQLDKAHADIYARNLIRVRQKLVDLEDKLGKTLRPLSQTPFFVLHDTLGYLTQAYNLPRSISLSVDPEQGLSLGRLRALKTQAAAHPGACLLGETYWGKSHVEKLAKSLSLRPELIDPMGYDLAAGVPLAYDEMMLGLAKTLSTCAKASQEG